MIVVVILLILLTLFYIVQSTKTNEDVQIIQTTLSTITDDIIREKYPIVIQDEPVDIDDVVKTVFKYEYMFLKKNVINRKKLHRIQGKFCIIQNINQNNIILKTKNKNDYFVDIILSPLTVLVLPFRWYLMCDNYDLNIIELFDFSHYCLLYCNIN